MLTYVEWVEMTLKGIDSVSPGICPENCDTCRNEWGDVEGSDCVDQGSFSRADCDSCHSTFAGDRFAAHGFIDGEVIHLSICVDCLMYHANGELPENWQRSPFGIEFN